MFGKIVLLKKNNNKKANNPKWQIKYCNQTDKSQTINKQMGLNKNKWSNKPEKQSTDIRCGIVTRTKLKARLCNETQQRQSVIGQMNHGPNMEQVNTIR